MAAGDMEAEAVQLLAAFIRQLNDMCEGRDSSRALWKHLVHFKPEMGLNVRQCAGLGADTQLYEHLTE